MCFGGKCAHPDTCAHSPNSASYVRPETGKISGIAGAILPPGTITRYRSGVPRNPIEIPISSTPFRCRLLVPGRQPHPLNSPDLFLRLDHSLAPFVSAASAGHPVASFLQLILAGGSLVAWVPHLLRPHAEFVYSAAHVRFVWSSPGCSSGSFFAGAS